MKKTYKTSPEMRIEKRMAARLQKICYKLVKRGGYRILVYNEVADGWIEADGMSPVPFSLSIDDVVELTHEYMVEDEKEELAEVRPAPLSTTQIPRLISAPRIVQS